jgi:predicted CoA-binding protein
MEFGMDTHTDLEIREIYDLKNIVVVEISKNEEKPAHFVPKYLIKYGYNVIPVNPTVSEVLGRKSHSTISDVHEDVDVVDTFRRSEDVPPIVDSAIKKNGIKFGCN